MKRKFVTLLLALALGASLVSCSKDNNEESSTPSVEESTLVEMKSIEDESIGEVDTYIELGDSININGSGAQADKNKVNITSSGTLNDGQIVVNSGDNDKVYIVLNGINITSSNSAPIYVKNADKTIISLADGTENVVEDSTNYVFKDGSTDELSAAIFSKDDLTFIGNGSLTVKGNYNNGSFDINSSDDSIHSNGELVINGGEINISSGNDGVHADTSLVINAAGGNGYLDYDGNFDISGGTLIAIGSLGMAQGPSDSSTQKSVSIGVNNQQGNVEFKILSSSGEEKVKYTPTKQYSSIIVSSSKFKDGESYDLYIGNSKVQNFTISGSVTNVGSSNGGNMGMPGGGKGNRR